MNISNSCSFRQTRECRIQRRTWRRAAGSLHYRYSLNERCGARYIHRDRSHMAPSKTEATVGIEYSRVHYSIQCGIPQCTTHVYRERARAAGGAIVAGGGARRSGAARGRPWDDAGTTTRRGAGQRPDSSLPTTLSPATSLTCMRTCVDRPTSCLDAKARREELPARWPRSGLGPATVAQRLFRSKNNECGHC